MNVTLATNLMRNYFVIVYKTHLLFTINRTTYLSSLMACWKFKLSQNQFFRHIKSNLKKKFFVRFSCYMSVFTAGS